MCCFTALQRAAAARHLACGWATAGYTEQRTCAYRRINARRTTFCFSLQACFQAEFTLLPGAQVACRQAVGCGHSCASHAVLCRCTCHGCICCCCSLRGSSNFKHGSYVATHVRKFWGGGSIFHRAALRNSTAFAPAVTGYWHAACMLTTVWCRPRCAVCVML